MSTYAPVGSLCNKWDLHFHTPSSFDYENKGISNQEIIDKLVASGIRVVAITDPPVLLMVHVAECQPDRFFAWLRRVSRQLSSQSYYPTSLPTFSMF